MIDTIPNILLGLAAAFLVIFGMSIPRGGGHRPSRAPPMPRGPISNPTDKAL